MTKLTLKEIYNLLTSNSDVLKIYKKIEEKEKKEGGYVFHNFEHIKNVTNIAEKS